VPQTQDQRKAETRRRLLGAAADLFARRGVHNTSADAIAEAADRTSGALYAHFGSKEGLLLALVAEWEHEVAVRTGDALSEVATGPDRLAAVWDQFANTGPDGDTWRLLEHELLLEAARNPDVAETLAGRYAYAREAMGDAFGRWADEAATALPRPPDRTATLVLGLLLGLELQRRLEPEAVPDELAITGLALLFGLDATSPAVAPSVSSPATPA
jgi:AcrR family transcriptional regulator